MACVGMAAHPATPTAYDMSGFSLPVARSLLDETNQIQRPGAGPSSEDRTVASILPMMMMMSQRKHAYHGLGYMGGLYGLGPGGGVAGGSMMGNPYANAMAFPLQQAHMMQANPFLDPSKNPFISALSPGARF